MALSRSKRKAWKFAATALLIVSSGCCHNGRCGIPRMQYWGCGGGRLGGGFATASRYPIPERYPLGSVNRSHYHAMQTNAEATDFVLNQHEFVGDTAELTRDGKDHILEIGARMRSAPFPVIVERSTNNDTPDLDAERRVVVARYLSEMGNPDADQRTIVSTPYARGLNSYEGENDYYRQFNFRGTTFGNFNNGSAFGGFGGGSGFGGGGFGY